MWSLMLMIVLDSCINFITLSMNSCVLFLVWFSFGGPVPSSGFRIECYDVFQFVLTFYFSSWLDFSLFPSLYSRFFVYALAPSASLTSCLMESFMDGSGLLLPDFTCC